MAQFLSFGVQLFGKGDSLEADRPDISMGGAEPIKYDVKLTGFGAAVKLNSQGCAVKPCPYRCASVKPGCCEFAA